MIVYKDGEYYYNGLKVVSSDGGTCAVFLHLENGAVIAASTIELWRARDEYIRIYQ